MNATLVLATRSPQRKSIFGQLNLRHEVAEPPEDGPPPPGIGADLAVQFVARFKAMSVAEQFPDGTFIISADTMVVGPDGPMSKPVTPERAVQMLRSLRGQRHTVLTGICALRVGSDEPELGLSRSAVKMRDFSDTELEQYVASGEPLDKAGGYAIQGGGGDLVEAVAGRIDTVIGLDVALALRLLARAGYPDPLPACVDASLTAPRASRRPLSPMRATQRA